MLHEGAALALLELAGCLALHPPHTGHSLLITWHVRACADNSNRTPPLHRHVRTQRRPVACSTAHTKNQTHGHQPEHKHGHRACWVKRKSCGPCRARRSWVWGKDAVGLAAHYVDPVGAKGGVYRRLWGVTAHPLPLPRRSWAAPVPPSSPWRHRWSTGGSQPRPFAFLTHPKIRQAAKTLWASWVRRPAEGWPSTGLLSAGLPSAG